MLVVQHDGIFKAIHPLVVGGYAVTVEAPSTAEAGDDIGVEVEVTTAAMDAPPDQVAVAVSNESATVRVNATKRDRGSYTATVPLGSLQPGNYSLYAVAQGEREIFGRRELLGMSDTVTLQVIESTGEDENATTGAETGHRTTDGTPTDSPTTNQRTSTNVITPVATDNPTASPGQGGFGAASVLVALLATVLFVRIRGEA